MCGNSLVRLRSTFSFVYLVLTLCSYVSNYASGEDKITLSELPVRRGLVVQYCSYKKVVPGTCTPAVTVPSTVVVLVLQVQEVLYLYYPSRALQVLLSAQRLYFSESRFASRKKSNKIKNDEMKHDNKYGDET